ncbi:MAG: hypothetical protein FWD17_14590, partial [Polyangiaceae bacterium]|nr:hypothetical protein [Polyangiaceae bacterium]
YNYLTSGNGPLAVATAAFTSAKAAQGAAQASSSAYTSEIQGLTGTYLNQIQAICGASVTQDLKGCGQSGGTLYQALGDVQNDIARMQEAQNKISDLAQQVQIEQQRAQQISQIYDAQAQLILQDGQQIQAIDAAQAAADEAADAFGFLGPILTIGFNVITGGTGAAAGIIGGVGGLFGAIGSTIKSVAADQATAAKDQIHTYESAQAAYNNADVTLITSAATVKDLLLQQANLGLELSIATESLAQATAKANDLAVQAQQLASEYAGFSGQAQAVQLQDLIQNRAYLSHEGVVSQQSMTNLLAWTFLATRALEYQLNFSYAPSSTLWTYLDPSDLNTGYVSVLNSYYLTNRTSAPQTNQDIISVRDQLLDMSQPVTDPVTGHTYTPQEQFQRYVADPAHHDQNGNVAIQFLTYRPAAQMPVFSANVCDDMIDTIQGNLIGANLGTGLSYAFMQLSRSGTSYLRDCNDPTTLTAYNLTGSGSSDLASNGSPSRARIQVGVNAPNNGTMFPANTDLTWQPLLTGPWTLTIDTRAAQEPQNQNLDVNGLDDITLVITHYANSVQ